MRFISCHFEARRSFRRHQPFAKVQWGSFSLTARTTRADRSAAIASAGSERVTTLPATTTVRAPIVTALRTVTLSSSTRTDVGGPAVPAFRCLASSEWQSVSNIATLAPHVTLVPSLIHWTVDIAVLLNPHPVPISINLFRVSAAPLHLLLSAQRLTSRLSPRLRKGNDSFPR
jgi:hypothetical protein